MQQRHNNTVRFKGCTNFRYRILLATLAAKPIRIEDIRPLDEQPGINDAEAAFLGLVAELTNGSKIHINETGTTVKYIPGFIVGGLGLQFECHPSRSIGYYLEPLILLALFAKTPLEIILKGVVNEQADISPDIMRVVTLPFLKHFGVEDGLELKIMKRGAPPLGGGEVLFRCNPVKTLCCANLCDRGRVKRVRGIAYTAKVNPMMATRVVTSARELLNKFIPDVWIFTDHSKGPSAGLSPGYALSLIAETTTGMLLSAEGVGAQSISPEDLGSAVSRKICDEIALGGCVDSAHQSMLTVLMALCPEDVSTACVGRLCQNAVDTLRTLKSLFGVQFQIKPNQNSSTSLTLTCKGVGFENLSRKPLA